MDIEQIQLAVIEGRAVHCAACGVLTTRDNMRCDCTRDGRAGHWGAYTIDDLCEAKTRDFNISPSQPDPPRA